MDISNLPVVDAHCHPFLPAKEEGEFYRFFNLSDLELPLGHVENTLLFRRVLKEMARFLNCREDYRTIAAARESRYKQNPTLYIQTLFQEAGIHSLVLDMGFPSEDNVGYTVPIETFSELVKVRTDRIFRIEPLISRLFRASEPFQPMLDTYVAELRKAVKDGGYCAFKSVIAYRTGLDVEFVSVEESAAAYERLRDRGVLAVPLKKKDPLSAREEKTVRDFLLRAAIIEGIRLGVPFQIHTGFGDSPMDLRIANPLHLYKMIVDEELRKAKIVLVHAGYPFTEETGFLASGYPNVYVDVSEMFPHSSIGMREKLLRLLEMAPANKILYGSDGYRAPELFWISAMWGKSSVGDVLAELVKKEAVDEDYAYRMAHMILSENAENLYRLGK